MPSLDPTPAETAAQAPAAQQAIARALPKVLLHDHLDGSLRESTLLELMHQRGMQAPAADEPGLRRWFDERAHAGSLEEYLRGFALTVEAMASLPALERVAYECAEDARLEGCVLGEFRIAPQLFEPFGVNADAAVEAMLAGLARCTMPTGLIVCAMRHHDDATIARAADLALRWQGRGVVAFDLAGPEAGWPATPHATLLRRVIDGGLGLTLHAGEADTAQRVLDAVRLGAHRIGHGVRLADRIGSADWEATRLELAERDTHFEVCPTSNVQTGAAASIAAHPIRALWQAGVSLSFNTDNRLISRTDASSEALALVTEAGFSWDDLRRMGQAAAQATFLGDAARQQAQQALASWAPPIR